MDMDKPWTKYTSPEGGRLDLGKGGFGSVHVVIRRKDGKKVACKVMSPLDSIRGHDSVAYTSIREIDLLLRLQEVGGVPKVYDVWPDRSGSVYMIMEQMKGSLYKLICNAHTKNPQPPILQMNVVRVLLFSLLRIVHEIHKRGIIHRDIKPENIMIGETPPTSARSTESTESIESSESINQSSISTKMPISITLIDFGLARDLPEGDSASQRPWSPGTVTRWYRPPELLLNEHPSYGAPVDIWSIGVLAIELVTGKCPFRGDSEEMQLRSIFECLGEPPEEFMRSTGWINAVQAVFRKKSGPSLRKQFLLNLINILGRENANFIDFIVRTLTFSPSKRITAEQALKLPFFDSFRVFLPRTVSNAETPSKFPYASSTVGSECDHVTQSLDKQVGKTGWMSQPDLKKECLWIFKTTEKLHCPRGVAPLACTNLLRAARSRASAENMFKDTRTLTASVLFLSSKVNSFAHISVPELCSVAQIEEKQLYLYELAVLNNALRFRVSLRSAFDVFDFEVCSNIWRNLFDYRKTNAFLNIDPTKEFSVPLVNKVEQHLWYWVGRMVLEATTLLGNGLWSLERLQLARASAFVGICGQYFQRVPVERMVKAYGRVSPRALNLALRSFIAVWNTFQSGEQNSGACGFLVDRFAVVLHVLRKSDDYPNQKIKSTILNYTQKKITTKTKESKKKVKPMKR